jgi:hypothetical protein
MNEDGLSGGDIKKPGRMPGYIIIWLFAALTSNATHGPDDQRHDQEGQENEKQDLGYACRSAGDTGEAKYTGDNRNHQKQKRIIKHDRLLSRLSETECVKGMAVPERCGDCLCRGVVPRNDSNIAEGVGTFSKPPRSSAEAR